MPLFIEWQAISTFVLQNKILLVIYIFLWSFYFETSGYRMAHCLRPGPVQPDVRVGRSPLWESERRRGDVRVPGGHQEGPLRPTRVQGRYAQFCFLLKKRKTSVLFVGPLVLLFWTSSDVCNGSPSLRASSFVCNWFLRFTSGATPADILACSKLNSVVIGCLIPKSNEVSEKSC